MNTLIKNYNNFLKVEPVNKPGTRVSKVKKTNYGYLVQMFNSYITLYYLKIQVNKNGSAKISWRIEKNYRATERFTTYYNCQGFEINKSEYKYTKTV